MKHKSIIVGIAGLGVLAGIYLLSRATRPTVTFVPSTIYRGDEVTVSWNNFEDGPLGTGTLYTSWGYAVYQYSTYEGSGSIVFSGSLTQQLMAGQYTLVVEQESVGLRAEAQLTVL